MTTKASFYRHKASGETVKPFTFQEPACEGGRLLYLTVPVAPLAGARSLRSMHSWLGEKDQFDKEFEVCQ